MSRFDLKSNANPVVLAGDLNSTGKNNTLTSICNEITIRVTDYQFWLKQAVSYFHPLGIFKIMLVPVHFFHGYMDLTALNVPTLWENRERGLFKSRELPLCR